jgi:hypothetical protein
MKVASRFDLTVLIATKSDDAKMLVKAGHGDSLMYDKLQFGILWAAILILY